MKTIPVIVATTLLLVCNQMLVVAQDSPNKGSKPLKGEVETSTRLPRPLLNAKTDFSTTTITKPNNQQLTGGTWTTPGPDFIRTEPMTGSLLNKNLDGKVNEHDAQTALKGESSKEQPPERKELNSPDQSDDEYPTKMQLSSKKILIRLKRFRSAADMEVVWEAARNGCRWLKKGLDVTILLDWDAVNVTNKEDTGQAWYEPGRGSGKGPPEKYSSPQDQLAIFIRAGGKVVASTKWFQLYSISYSHLLEGTRLISEDEMDDLLIDPRYTVIYY